MPLFSGLPWLKRSRERAAAAKQEQPKDDTEGFTDLENDFFAQGEDPEAMKKSSEERVSDLFIGQKEREQGQLERRVLEAGEMQNMENLLAHGSNLDNVDLPDVYKAAFLENKIKMLEAKKKALSKTKNPNFESIRDLNTEIQTLRDMRENYLPEIDINDPDGGEPITLEEDEEAFDLIIEDDDEETPLAA